MSDAIREAFEAWHADKHFELIMPNDTLGDGTYRLSAVQNRWLIWQAALQSSQTAPAVPDDGAVAAMVDAFLSWELPKDFSPDGGVSFEKPAPEHAGWWPVGTNLLDHDQATAMVRHMLTATPQPDHSPDAGKVMRGEPVGKVLHGTQIDRDGTRFLVSIECNRRLAPLTPLYTHPAESREEIQVQALKWSDHQKPNNQCSYDHVTADTPFGRFLITWKSWKEYDDPTIDETPWGEFGGVGCDLADAKNICEREYLARLRASQQEGGE